MAVRALNLGYDAGMPRIGDAAGNDPLPTTFASPARPVAPAGGAESFQQAVSGAQHHQAQGQPDLEPEAAFYEVDRSVQMLLKSPVMAHVAAFRQAIAKFLKVVQPRLDRADSKTDRRNRTLVILREIDRKLAELTDNIVNQLMGPVELAASIDEIRGLLMDLLV